MSLAAESGDPDRDLSMNINPLCRCSQFYAFTTLINPHSGWGKTHDDPHWWTVLDRSWLYYSAPSLMLSMDASIYVFEAVEKGVKAFYWITKREEGNEPLYPLYHLAAHRIL